MANLIINVPFPKWFVPYGNKPSVICDARLTWFILQLGSVNGQSSTFCCYPWRWADPYTSMSYALPNAPVVHATFTTNPGNSPSLWIYGFGANVPSCFQSVPDFVFSTGAKTIAPDLAAAHDRSAFNFASSGHLSPPVEFTSAPPLGHDKQLGIITRVIERYKINRIAKRNGITP